MSGCELYQEGIAIGWNCLGGSRPYGISLAAVEVVPGGSNLDGGCLAGNYSGVSCPMPSPEFLS